MTRRVWAIQDGREIDKAQNGLGITEDLAYTLDTTGAQAVAIVDQPQGPGDDEPATAS